MKLFVFTLLLINFSNYLFSQGNISIYGKITNPKDDSVFIKNDFNKGYIEVSKGIIDKKGNFRLTFNINDTATYYFIHGDERTEMYLMPNFNLKLTLDTKQFDKTVHYEGEGKKYNNYIAKRILFFEKIDNVNNYEDDEQTYLKKIDSTQKIKLNFINNNAKFDINLFNKEKNECLQEKYYNLYMYPFIKSYYEDSTFTVSKNYPDPFSELDPNNAHLLKVNYYKDNVKQFISKKIMPYDSLYYERFIDTTIKYISLNSSHKCNFFVRQI